ncbi:exonuclease 1-like [Penaeus japonicus]|uniref:exonuclease 1-like n=1 Tax=Penaeus japonicus TaxID=27405 RepID=UPI001C70F38E|nr:exonuclease 1-like [Penaeus japonicus]
MFAVFCVLFLTTPELISAPASHSVLDEVAFKTLGFEFEMLLKNHLRDWRFLTETPTEMDMGEFFSKRNFISRSNTTSPEDLKNDTRNPDQMKKHININSPGNNLKDSEVIPPKESDLIDFSEQDHMAANIPPDLNTESGASGPTRKLDSNAIEVSERSGRAARDAGIPVIYMPGKKKKRKCSQVSGLLAGFNTFNYLTFVTGVITLVVNANNNINNNNNNNNLNNNNDISNNNVNANTNTQNANQVVIFPPGRKRRSIADWLLQVLNLPSVKGAKTPAATPPTVSKGSWCGAAEAATVALQLFDSWVQASSGVSGECGWAEYCFLLHNLGRREGVSAALFNPARTFSTLVAPAWVASSASCFLQRAKCRIV